MQKTTKVYDYNQGQLEKKYLNKKVTTRRFINFQDGEKQYLSKVKNHYYDKESKQFGLNETYSIISVDLDDKVIKEEEIMLFKYNHYNSFKCKDNAEELKKVEYDLGFKKSSCLENTYKFAKFIVDFDNSMKLITDINDDLKGYEKFVDFNKPEIIK